jgi:hypothetical protein
MNMGEKNFTREHLPVLLHSLFVIVVNLRDQDSIEDRSSDVVVLDELFE